MRQRLPSLGASGPTAAFRASGAFRGFGALGLAGVLGAALLLPASASAYVCSRVDIDSGPSLMWAARSVSWYLADPITGDIPDHNAAVAEIQAAFTTWEGPSCTDLKLPFAGEQAGLVAGYDSAAMDNKNIVVFVRNGWPYDSGVVAVTTNSFDSSTGEIFDSDIEVNDQSFQFTIADATCDPRSGVMDLRNTLTHEVGHLIGLDHPPDSPEYETDTMFASAPPCETQKRTLKADDIAGLCKIYPTGLSAQQCYPPDSQRYSGQGSGSASSGGSGRSGGCAALPGAAQGGLLLVGAWFALLRRRTRARAGRSDRNRSQDGSAGRVPLRRPVHSLPDQAPSSTPT